MHLKLVGTPKGELPDFMIDNGVESLPWFWAPFSSPVFAIAMVLVLPTLAAAGVGYLMFRKRTTGILVGLQREICDQTGDLDLDARLKS